MPGNIPPDLRDFFRAVEVCISLLRRLQELYPHLADGNPKWSGMNDAGWNQFDGVKRELEQARLQATETGRALAENMLDTGGDHLPILRLVQRVGEVADGLCGQGLLGRHDFRNDLHNLVAALRAERPLIEAACIVARRSGSNVPGAAVSGDQLSEKERAAYRAERAELQKAAGREASAMVGESEALLRAWHEIYVAAHTDERVLISGETGTGKLLAAKVIHRASDRRNGPFERLDCGRLSDTLAESELFGHVKGGFTDAINDKEGRFELANRGILCLEEIENLSPECQAKLLAVLDDDRLRRVGGVKDITVDVRVIAVTNAPLDKLVKEGKFRQDLYGRLNVLRVTMPTLRHRQGDIRLLATAFGNGLLTEAEVADLEPRDYPENVRGLMNEVVRIIAGRRATDSGTSVASTGTGRPKIELTKEQINAALADGHTVRDAALRLNVSEDTLQRRMKAMGIPSPT